MMCLKKIMTVSIALATIFLSAPCSQADAATGPTMDDYNWWRAARFGIFIHWGPSSILELGGGSWTRSKDYLPPGEWKVRSTNRTSSKIPEAISSGDFMKLKGRNGIPQEIYDNLFHIFNPVKFNAEAWAKTFKATGARYVVLVTKHHDGFCMFETEHTDYNIMNTPFARDVAKELSKACQKQGIEIIWYYSAPDWYDTRYDVNNIEPYVKYVTGQMNELFSNYPNIRGVWWDGGVKCDTTPIYEEIYRHVDGPIFNFRGFKTPGVRFATPEQKLGSFDMKRPWESCACITDCSWFWNGGKGIKSANVCLRLLIDSAKGDGNLLLDFGPTPEGEIYEPIRQVFLEMGQWLKENGNSIYDTRGGPYTPGSWGGATRKDNTVFLHITQAWPGGKLELPPLPAKIKSATTQDGKAVKFNHTKEGLKIELDPRRHTHPDTIIRLTLDRPAIDLPVIETPLYPSLTYNTDATASSAIIRGAMGSPKTVVLSSDETGATTLEFGETPSGPRKHKKEIDPELLKERPWLRLHRGHYARCWLADPAEKTPWLQVDLGEPKTFRQISLFEKVSRIDGFKIQVERNGKWETLYTGKDLGFFSLQLPKPVTAQKVRLLITDWHHDGTKQGPGIHNFDLYAQ